jgi:uncharacterized tellurite resistance protein B-like protein
MSREFDFSKYTDNEQAACYGALIAMAAADGDFHEDERALILASLDRDSVSPAVRAAVEDFVSDPPSLSECLDALKYCEATLRFAVMVALMDVAFADDQITEAEASALAEAARAMQVTAAEGRAIEEFIQEIRRVRSAGYEGVVASVAMREATKLLQAAEIPSDAGYFSTKVAGRPENRPLASEGKPKVQSLMNRLKKRKRGDRMRSLMNDLTKGGR